MREIFERIKLALECGETGALVTITRVTGSTPRKPGTKMLMLANGEVVGTIGGGCLEAEIWADARKVMNSGLPLLITRGVAFGAEGDNTNELSSGTAEIFIEPIGVS